jgi:2-oxoisovalerate dehydrogenase E1 component alpha subunit
MHYRNNGVLMAMGQPMIDFIRQMKSVSTDPFSGGRNFVSHTARKDWNIMPVTSTIETQFSVAPGTALAQRRARLRGENAGVSIVIGGDAGTAEGDFATCMIWSSRPGKELPLLMIVTHNKFGISTPCDEQHGEKNITDRAKPFGIKTAITDGNSPEKIWSAIEDALDYVRSTGRPFMLEVEVSRLHGHSSSSGANRVKNEACCIEGYEKKLIKNGWITSGAVEKLFEEARQEASTALEQVRKEPVPDAATVLDHSFANGARAGIPGRDC